MTKQTTLKGTVIDELTNKEYFLFIKQQEINHSKGKKNIIRLSSQEGKIGFCSFYDSEEEIHFGGMKIRPEHRGNSLSNILMEIFFSSAELYNKNIGETLIQNKPAVCLILINYGFIPLGEKKSRIKIMSSKSEDGFRIYFNETNMKEKFISTNIYLNGDYQILESCSQKEESIEIKLGVSYKLKDYDKLNKQRELNNQRFTLKI